MNVTAAAVDEVEGVSTYKRRKVGKIGKIRKD